MRSARRQRHATPTNDLAKPGTHSVYILSSGKVLLAQR